LQDQPSFKALFEKFLANQCTPDEFKQVMEVLTSQGEDSEVSQWLKEHMLTELPANYKPEPGLQERLEKRFNLIQEHNDLEQTQFDEPPKRVIRWWRPAAAAMVLLLTGIGGYWYTHRQPLQELSAVQPKTSVTVPDIAAPASNHAVITLPDGRKIVLDSARNGALAGNLVKLNDDQLSYDGNTKVKPEYHTLTVPKGSRLVKLVLSDGTRVWINAASSLHYPTSFPDSLRKVEITGEAYFEVAKVPGKKFIVSSNGVTTEVLGTHFNVNAYDDETNMKITLLEGSVKVHKEKESGILVPGQQAQFNSSGKLNVISQVGLAEVVAWKDGFFHYNGENIETIMRELTRWYDVQVEYKGKVPDHPFVAKIPRDVPVSELLKLLSLTELVHFKIDDKKITVMP
jgi:transmembrane sensor